MALFAGTAPAGCGGDTGSPGTSGASGTTGGASATSGGVNSSGGATTQGGVATSGGASSLGGSTATSGGASTTSGGVTTTSGGSATSGGAAGKAGSGGATTTGGASTGSGGKACHSTVDWTPKADDIWIAPDGNDSNVGSEASPKKNLTAGVTAWSAGKTIWVKPGTYAHSAPIALSTNGTASGMLRISGVTGGAKPVFDFAGEPRASSAGNDGQRGFQISGAYIHLRYLEVKNASDNCVYVTGSNNTIEWLTIHDCQDTGLQISNGPANTKVLNVDSYLNADPTGENADGFAPKLTIGQNTYFCGTRAYQNTDDGYDCWAAGDNSPVTFEYCWAFGQPGPKATANSDGNGFKLGSPADRAAGGNAAHKLINCFAFGNRSVGFTANGNNSGDITCTNCGVWGNATAFSAGTGGVTPQHTGDITNLSVSVEKAIAAPRDANGNLPDITKL